MSGTFAYELYELFGPFEWRVVFLIMVVMMLICLDPLLKALCECVEAIREFFETMKKR